MRFEILTLINLYLDIHEGIKCLSFEPITGRPDPYLDSLQIKPRVLPKDKILFLISNFNFITENIQQVDMRFEILINLYLDICEGI
jgi:hypothetical protein